MCMHVCVSFITFWQALASYFVAKSVPWFEFVCCCLMIKSMLCILLNFYLSIYGCGGSFVAVSSLSLLRWEEATSNRGARASHRGGFSCCGAYALGTRVSVVAAGELHSCSHYRAYHAASVVVVHRAWFLHGTGNLPDQELNPCLLRQVDSKSLDRQGGPLPYALATHISIV